MMIEVPRRVEIGSISEQTRHVHPISTFWKWGVGILPLMSRGGRPPSGMADTFEDALQAFKEAFSQWHATLPSDKWQENLEHMRHGQERWKK
jgi:hypothetical protein